MEERPSCRRGGKIEAAWWRDGPREPGRDKKRIPERSLDIISWCVAVGIRRHGIAQTAQTKKVESGDDGAEGAYFTGLVGAHGEAYTACCWCNGRPGQSAFPVFVDAQTKVCFQGRARGQD